MTKSEYLFGHTPDRYALLQEPLAKLKIHDAKKLLAELVPQRRYEPNKDKEFQEALDARINEVLEAIKLWEKILQDGKD